MEVVNKPTIGERVAMAQMPIKRFLQAGLSDSQLAIDCILPRKQIQNGSNSGHQSRGTSAQAETAQGATARPMTHRTGSPVLVFCK